MQEVPSKQKRDFVATHTKGPWGDFDGLKFPLTSSEAFYKPLQSLLENSIESYHQI